MSAPDWYRDIYVARAFRPGSLALQQVEKAVKHARKDYDKTMKAIPKDEPVFLLRGQDAVAGNVVRFWAAAAATAGASPEIVAAARKHAELMDAWPTKKIPDMPEGSAETADEDTHDGKGPVA